MTLQHKKLAEIFLWDVLEYLIEKGDRDAQGIIAGILYNNFRPYLADPFKEMHS